MNVLARIKELLDDRGWSYYRLAKNMDKPTNTVSDMFKRNTIPSIPTLELICHAFGITLQEFFAADEEPVILTNKAKRHLQAYSKLDEKEQALADAYVFGLAKYPMESGE